LIRQLKSLDFVVVRGRDDGTLHLEMAASITRQKKFTALRHDKSK
jgi:hypothetical protein